MKQPQPNEQLKCELKLGFSLYEEWLISRFYLLWEENLWNPKWMKDSSGYLLLNANVWLFRFGDLLKLLLGILALLELIIKMREDAKAGQALRDFPLWILLSLACILSFIDMNANFYVFSELIWNKMEGSWWQNYLHWVLHLYLYIL